MTPPPLRPPEINGLRSSNPARLVHCPNLVRRLRDWAVTVTFWGLAVLPLFYSLGDHPVYNSSEARYASIARAMAEGESPLLVPHWYGEPHLTKPPGFYWLLAASIRLLGDNPWAIRLPAALCGVGVLIVTHRLVRRLYGREHARLTVAFVAVSPLFIGTHRAAVTDGALHLAMIITLYAGLIACYERRSRWWLAAGGMAAAGAFIKGPVAWYPLGFCIGLEVIGRNGRGRLLWSTLAAAALLAVTPLAGWGVLVAGQVPGGWAVWWQEVAGRFSGGADHPRPWWFSLPVLLIGLFPATAWLCPPGPRRRSGREQDQELAAELSSVAGGPGSAGAFFAERQWWLYSLGLLAPVLLMRGQLMTYLLPLTVPVTVLAAGGVLRWLGFGDVSGSALGDVSAAPCYRPHPAGVTLVLATAFGVGMVLVATGGWLIPVGWFWPIPLLILIGAVMSATPPRMWRLRRRCLGVGWGVMIVAACWAATLEDRLWERGGSAALVAQAESAMGGPPVTVWTVGWTDESIGYHARHRPRQVDPRFTEEEWAEPGPRSAWSWRPRWRGGRKWRGSRRPRPCWQQRYERVGELWVPDSRPAGWCCTA